MKLRRFNRLIPLPIGLLTAVLLGCAAGLAQRGWTPKRGIRAPAEKTNRGEHEEGATGRSRKRRPRRSTRASIGFLLPAATLVIAGLLLQLFEVRPGVVVVVLGIFVFVAGAWLQAHPERGGYVGHPDINPWGVG